MWHLYPEFNWRQKEGESHFPFLDEFVIKGSFACKDEMKITEPAATIIGSTAAVTTMICDTIFLTFFAQYVQHVRLTADVVNSVFR